MSELCTNKLLVGERLVCYMKRIILLLCFGAACLLLASCEDCTYITQNVQYVRVGFRNPITQTPKDTLLAADIIGLIPGSFTPMEKPLPLPEGARAFINMPLFTRYDTTIFRFVAQDEDTADDTIMFRYRRRIVILPPDCGYDEAISDLEVIFHTYDSVKIINTELKATNTEIDVQIFD
jgi:hypothetical protein